MQPAVAQVTPPRSCQGILVTVRGCSSTRCGQDRGGKQLARGCQNGARPHYQAVQGTLVQVPRSQPQGWRVDTRGRCAAPEKFQNSQRLLGQDCPRYPWKNRPPGQGAVPGSTGEAGQDEHATQTKRCQHLDHQAIQTRTSLQRQRAATTTT